MDMFYFSNNFLSGESGNKQHNSMRLANYNFTFFLTNPPNKIWFLIFFEVINGGSHAGNRLACQARQKWEKSIKWRWCVFAHRIHVTGIFTHIWLIFMVNVGIIYHTWTWVGGGWLRCFLPCGGEADEQHLTDAPRQVFFEVFRSTGPSNGCLVNVSRNGWFQSGFIKLCKFWFL